MSARDLIENDEFNWKSMLHEIVDRLADELRERFSLVIPMQLKKDSQYLVKVAVFELANGYKMSTDEIRAAIKRACDLVHPRMFRQTRLEIPPYTRLPKSGKTATIVKIHVTA